MPRGGAPLAARVTLRDLTPEEQQALAQRAQARTAPVRLVERARIIQAAAPGPRPSALAEALPCSRPPVSSGSRRFHEQGLHGGEERPRSGQPHPSTAEPRAEVHATAGTDPKVRDLPFGWGTRDRVPACLDEQTGLPSKRRRRAAIRRDAGLRGRKPETGLDARVEPEGAEQRGSSRRSAPLRRRAASSSVATRGAPPQPRACRASPSSASRRSQRPSPPSRRRTPRGGTLPSRGPSQRSTPGGVARGPSSASSARPPARP